jgi:hypothetical protein
MVQRPGPSRRTCYAFSRFRFHVEHELLDHPAADASAVWQDIETTGKRIRSQVANDYALL